MGKENTLQKKSKLFENILDRYGEIGMAKAMQIQLLNSYQYENHNITSEIIA